MVMKYTVDIVKKKIFILPIKNNVNPVVKNILYITQKIILVTFAKKLRKIYIIKIILV